MKAKHIFLAIGTVYLITGCSNYLAIGQSRTKFREENAPFAGISLVGYKQEELSHHRFVRQSKQPVYGSLQVRPITEQHQADTEKAAVKARVDAGRVVSAGVNAATSAKVKARYDVVEVTDDLPSKLNDRRNAAVLQDLANWGKAARIVTAVAIAYGYKSTANHSFAGNATATYNVYTGNLETSGSVHRTTSLSDGTVFAYRMSKICWKRDPKGRLIVAEVVLDDPGRDMECPNGSSNDPSQVP